MLAHSFLSAEDLDISSSQLKALIKTLKLFETGKLKHVQIDDDILGEMGNEFTGHFSMVLWNIKRDCGTVCCIGGTAELIGGVIFNTDKQNERLTRLFFPHFLGQWNTITPAHAAQALRNYLTTGDPRWREVVAS